MGEDATTPRGDGFAMPAEWEEHEACLMAWPARRDLWAERWGEAKRDYAEVARAIGAFEPVVMVCRPGDEAEVRDACGADVTPLPLPIDDSWMRDNGPIFVRDGGGRIALVDFGFNAWGEKFHPYDLDARVPARLAGFFGVPRYEAPFVLEGGSFFVDGEGTLITTEQCLLNPNRNPSMTRTDIEDGLREYLGVETVIWLGLGGAGDRDTDGHVDGIAQYLGPGRVILLVPSDERDPNFTAGRENLDRLTTGRDARERSLEVVPFDAGRTVGVPYLNLYLPNGGVVMPVGGFPEDDEAVRQVQEAFPDRKVVTVPGTVLDFGGGGPHCITQQVPVGVGVPRAGG